MTFFGYFVLVVTLFSVYAGYRIFSKIIRIRNRDKKEGSIPEKIFLLFFVCLVMIVINTLTFVLSYSFFWEKAYRTLSENRYEAVVTGYKKEMVKSQSFRNSSYSDKPVYFPEVEYTNREGDKITKTLDIAENNPPHIGQRLQITDKSSENSANAVDLNWMMLFLGSIFTAMAAFSACLLWSYTTAHSLKKRLILSIYCGLLILSLNIACIAVIYLKQ